MSAFQTPCELTIRVKGKLPSGLVVVLTGAKVIVGSDAGEIEKELKRPDLGVDLPEDLRHAKELEQKGTFIMRTDETGRAKFPLPGIVSRYHYGVVFRTECVSDIIESIEQDVELPLKNGAFDLQIYTEGGQFESLRPSSNKTRAFGKSTVIKFRWPGDKLYRSHFNAWLDSERLQVWPSLTGVADEKDLASHYHVLTDREGPFTLRGSLGNVAGKFDKSGDDTWVGDVAPPQPSLVGGDVNVSMRRTASRMTEDVPLWAAIRRGTEALSFDRYLDFMEWVFCGSKIQFADTEFDFSKASRRSLPFTDTDAYRNVKVATEAFVMANCGVIPRSGTIFTSNDAEYIANQVVIRTDANSLGALFDIYRRTTDDLAVLPYLAIIRQKLKGESVKDTDIGDVDIDKIGGKWQSDAKTCYGLLRQRLTNPCLLELIWSYWQEEGMLVQTMNAITRRFQNMRASSGSDPLANLEIDPLRPLNNVFWGYIQDEQHRLSVVRRNYEYDHHYGLRLAGKAVRDMRTADSRSKFLEGFHTLLSIVSGFYKRDDDTTIVADGFPVLNALKEAHIILSQGAHNQFGDLPSTARIEMLMQQWILARPEFREFLPTRIMVAYPEPWMDRVDAMKKVQGWTDTSVLHFRNLAIFGEQVLLSIRYGAWADVIDPAQAANWARYWRPEIQGYLHAYRSVTSVDLSVDVTNARIDATLPSVHLVQKLSEQRRLVAG